MYVTHCVLRLSKVPSAYALLCDTRASCCSILSCLSEIIERITIHE